MELSLELLHVN